VETKYFVPHHKRENTFQTFGKGVMGVILAAKRGRNKRKKKYV
jgi:hypothetical protein